MLAEYPQMLTSRSQDALHSFVHSYHHTRSCAYDYLPIMIH
jgi:hypothetical protein